MRPPLDRNSADDLRGLIHYMLSVMEVRPFDDTETSGRWAVLNGEAGLPPRENDFLLRLYNGEPKNSDG